MHAESLVPSNIGPNEDRYATADYRSYASCLIDRKTISVLPIENDDDRFPQSHAFRFFQSCDCQRVFIIDLCNHTPPPSSAINRCYSVCLTAERKRKVTAPHSQFNTLLFIGPGRRNNGRATERTPNFHTFRAPENFSLPPTRCAVQQFVNNENISSSSSSTTRLSELYNSTMMI